MQHGKQNPIATNADAHEFLFSDITSLSWLKIKTGCILASMRSA
jgi:hypothetical protein